MMSNHTPGPWKENMLGGGKGGPNSFSIREDVASGDGVYAIAKVHGRHDRTARANAYLIAAAPELLAALRNLMQRCVANCDGPTLLVAPEWSQALAALARAEGTPPPTKEEK